MIFKFNKILLICYSLFIFIFGVAALIGFVLNFIYNQKDLSNVAYPFIYVALTAAFLDIILWVRYSKVVESIKRIYYVFMLGSLAIRELDAIRYFYAKINISVLAVIIAISICVFIVPAIIKIIRLYNDVYLD